MLSCSLRDAHNNAGLRLSARSHAPQATSLADSGTFEAKPEGIIVQQGG
jgi:hypothetical protein